MAGGSDKNWVLEGPTVWQKNFNFAFSGVSSTTRIQSVNYFSVNLFLSF